VSRNGENSTYGSTRGLREGRYGSRIEVHREISGEPTESWSHCTEVLLYKLLSSGTFDWGQMIESQVLLFSIDIIGDARAERDIIGDARAERA